MLLPHRASAPTFHPYPHVSVPLVWKTIYSSECLVNGEALGWSSGTAVANMTAYSDNPRNIYFTLLTHQKIQADEAAYYRIPPSTQPLLNAVVHISTTQWCGTGSSYRMAFLSQTTEEVNVT